MPSNEAKTATRIIRRIVMWLVCLLKIGSGSCGDKEWAEDTEYHVALLAAEDDACDVCLKVTRKMVDPQGIQSA